MHRIVILALALASCGTEQLVCSQTDADGTYLVTATTVSGDCGDLPSTLVQKRAGQETTGSGCVRDYERWSENECKLESSVTCTDAINDTVTKGIGVIEQQDDDGASYSGTMSISITTIAGAYVCSGTYDVTYARQ